MILVDKNSAFQIIGVLKVLKFLSFAVKSRSKTEMKKILTAFTRAREQVSIDYFFSNAQNYLSNEILILVNLLLNDSDKF